MANGQLLGIAHRALEKIMVNFQILQHGVSFDGSLKHLA